MIIFSSLECESTKRFDFFLLSVGEDKNYK